MNIKVEKGSQMVNILQKIHPLAVTLRVTTAELNKEGWMSQLNPEDDAYSRGRTQLSKHTLLILDETHMEAGDLTQTGLSNFHYLQEVVSKGVTKCDCAFSTVQFRHDLKVVVVSLGKSLFDCEFMLSVLSPCQLEPSHLAVDTTFVT